MSYDTPYSEIEAQMAACEGCYAKFGARFVLSGCMACRAIVTASRGLEAYRHLQPTPVMYREDVKRCARLILADTEDPS